MRDCKSMKLSIPLSVEDAILWRRDVRRFKPLPVDDQLLLRVLDLADHAPSVGNSQPWRVVMVETSDRRERVRQLHILANIAAAAVYEADRRLQYQKLKLAGFDAAPIHIAVFCDETTKQGHGLGNRTMPEMLRYSCVSMISTLWLAARAEGLGVGWVSILDPKEVATCLGVTPSWVLVGYLLLGWPEEEHLDPELERFGWQSGTDSRTRISRV